jgi:biotin carboxyl carrier protein
MTGSLPALALSGEVPGLGCPGVGWFTPVRAEGELVEPGVVIGSLVVLGRRFDVLVPGGIIGRLADGTGEHAVPRGYGERLFSVASIEFGAEMVGAGTEPSEGDAIVRAQMDGQFYRRPSPTEPDFVSVGQTIEPGTTIGLIEDMKFFYPILFESDCPAVVRALLAEDATPVEAGDPLISVE